MSDDVVPVFHSASPVELGMAKGILEEADIPCAVSGSSASSFLTAYVGTAAAGMQALVVPSSFAEQAAEALEAAFGPDDADPQAESET